MTVTREFRKTTNCG